MAAWSLKPNRNYPRLGPGKSKANLEERTKRADAGAAAKARKESGLPPRPRGRPPEDPAVVAARRAKAGAKRRKIAKAKAEAERNRKADIEARKKPALFREVPPHHTDTSALAAWVDLTHFKQGVRPGPVPVVRHGKELPGALYYAIAFTYKARRLLRVAMRDLWEEGLIQPIFIEAAKRNKAVKPAKLMACLRQWCLLGNTHAEIAETTNLNPGQVRDSLDLALQLVVSTAKPKALRDELVRVVLGERLPQFTHQEVQRMLKEPLWQTPLTPPPEISL